MSGHKQFRCRLKIEERNKQWNKTNSSECRSERMEREREGQKKKEGELSIVIWMFWFQYARIQVWTQRPLFGGKLMASFHWKLALVWRWRIFNKTIRGIWIFWKLSADLYISKKHLLVFIEICKCGNTALVAETWPLFFAKWVEHKLKRKGSSGYCRCKNGTASERDLTLVTFKIHAMETRWYKRLHSLERHFNVIARDSWPDSHWQLPIIAGQSLRRKAHHPTHSKAL